MKVIVPRLLINFFVICIFGPQDIWSSLVELYNIWADFTLITERVGGGGVQVYFTQGLVLTVRL